MQIKIYDKDFNNKTSLVAVDYNNLQFSTSLGSDGDFSFDVRADNPKLNEEVLRNFNRVRIYDGPTLLFTGFILEKNYTLNLISIKGYSLSNMLKRKLFLYTDPNNQSIYSFIADIINYISDTGITMGDMTIPDFNITKQYYGNTIERVLDDCLGNNQWYIDENGKLQIAEVLGEDRSDILLQYDYKKIESANILNFKIQESGDQAYNYILAKDNTITTIVSDIPAIDTYGKNEVSLLYDGNYDEPNLQLKASKDLKTNIYTPELNPAPNADTSFKTCDKISVRIRSKYLDVNTIYQIITKSYKVYDNNSYVITIKVNDKTDSIIDVLALQQKRIQTLEKLI